MTEVELSIVIPAFNEETRLGQTVIDAVRWCVDRRLSFEIIISDDGSQDGTLQLARGFEKKDRRIRTLACARVGKGAAVRSGMLNSKGRLVLFMDADGATPLSEISKLMAAIEAGSDVAIGSRVSVRAGEIDVKTSACRRLVRSAFAFFVRAIAIDGFADTQCGFKMFRRGAVEPIFRRQEIPGFAFDVEILLIARRLAFRIAEAPVNWDAQPGSKVRIVPDSLRMLRDIARIRWIHRRLNSRVHVSQDSSRYDVPDLLREDGRQ